MTCKFLALLMALSMAVVPLFSTAAGSERTTIVFMGDLVFDGTIGDRIETHGAGYPFEKMMPYIDDADLTFANLETPISDRGIEEEGKYCTFRSDPSTIGCLEYAGIDAVSLANNHCLDYSYDALNDTMEHLEDAGVEHAGIWFGDMPESAHPKRPVVLEAAGLSFGFLAYTEDVRDHWMAAGDLPGPMPLDEDVMEIDVRHASSEVDVLIVSIHWRKWPQYTKGPEESDIELCRDLIDKGADIIMGHGPHTVHRIEGYKDGLILYSLGNAAMDTANDSSDYSYLAKVTVGDDGSISSMELIPIYKETHRYVPMGTPVERGSDMGFNVSYDDVWDMYEDDSYDVVDEEGRLEILLAVKGAPWYLKGFFAVSAVIIISGVFYISRELIKRKRARRS